MSITPQDVHHVIDHNRDKPGLRQRDVSRIVRVLNAHRRSTTAHLSDGAPATPDSRSGSERRPD